MVGHRDGGLNPVSLALEPDFLIMTLSCLLNLIFTMALETVKIEFIIVMFFDKKLKFW